MKNIILLLSLFLSATLFSQTFYQQQWKKIEANYKKGTYKSNLPIIKEIQNQAMKDNNAVQIIKSLKAEFSIINQTHDDTQNDAASQFFGKLKTYENQLKGDDQLLYKVLLGEFFSEYYENDSWEIDQRTNLDNQDFAKIETWSRLDFKNFLSKHYTELEKESPKLKRITLSKYKEIFENVENFDYFPTLFDWNAANQIQFLRNEQLFTNNELKANHEKINAVYDGLISANSGNPKLYFQHQKIDYNCTFTNCKNRFEQLENLVEDESTTGDYKVAIIADIMQVAQEKQDFKLALIWANDARELYPKSKFLANISNLENAIKMPVLAINYEGQTQPEKPIHIVAEGKNVDQFSLNIYAVKDDFQGLMNFVVDEYRYPFKTVKKMLVRKDEFSLKNLNDFKSHQTSLELKPLPKGIYLAEYVVENNIQKSFYFVVSENKIVYQKKNDKAEKTNILKLVQNENGNPVTSQKLDIYEFVRNGKFTKQAVTTGSEGDFRFPVSQNKDYYRYYLVQDSKGNANIVDSYGNDAYYYPNERDEDEGLAQIFLDRGIYRPGQTVYFKVISTILDAKSKKEKTASKINLNVILKDFNGEEISAQKLTTNDFGSVNGSFVLPKGKLNGRFTIDVDNDYDAGKYDISGQKSFLVEEYKRPKFEVTFDPVKTEYKYGQTIEIRGKAMMFSGVALSNSTVNYEIKKQNIRWRYFWWYPRNENQENSILGTVQTNEKGEFTIKVELKKDETLDGIQIDNYNINASVTDINGETQSAETNLKVASVSHYFSVKNESDKTQNENETTDYFSNENIKLSVETKNYNDQLLQKSYHVKLSKLEEPNRIFRDNFARKIQDLPVFSKEEFVQKFPHDRFDKNEEQKNWKVEKIIVERLEEQRAKNKDNTKNPKTDNPQPATNLDLGKLEPGTYKLELYNIEGKDTIKTEQYFGVWDQKKLGPKQFPFLKVVQPKTDYKRGEKAKIFAYSAIPDALVHVFIQDGKGGTRTETKNFKNGVLEYEIPVPYDESITKLNLQFQLVAFNDVQTEVAEITIANQEKTLQIETTTFRDKLEPGQKEKWSVKILGNDKDSSTSLRVTAEVLANMYDKSLDQFVVNTYSWQKLFQNPYYIIGYDYRQNLSQEYFSKRLPYLKNENINQPHFDWFGGGIYGNQMVMYETSAPMAASKSAIEEVVVTGMGIKKESRAVGYATDSVKTKDIEEKTENLDKIPVRENLNETAFFYPNLLTDKDGNVSFEFTSPEALTAWKVMFLATTKEAQAATLEKTVVTQKEFSVTPNYPRFLREGDELKLQSKISNLRNEKLTGTAQLQILDAFTNEDISEKFGLNQLNAAAGYNVQQAFSVEANGNSVVDWNLKVPKDVSSIILKIVAKAASPLNPLSKGEGTSRSFSDGEQKAVAVLPNRMLVTDALPIFVKEGQTKTFTLEDLKNSNSTTVTNVSNTLELTTNPVWELIFALPSLKNDQNNSADVIFNKWFADVLASEIFKANPKMKTVFEEYQNKGLLTSNLEKNQELKQLLLEETPWVLESKNETEQMAKIALLFDVNTMRNSIQNDWSELVKLQNPDGGFSWYSGYPSSYYTSLYILKNLGKINDWLKGNAADYQSSEQNEMVKNLVSYVDNEVNKYWRTDQDNVWTNFVLDYLDTRNYWEKEYPLKNKGATLKTQIISKAKKAEIKDFTFFGLHRAALLFNNYGLKEVSNKLMTYLKETSTDTETQGVYWKQNLNDWGWYSSKTVNHAGALEAFQKLKPADQNFIEEMKIWLITQKEVNSWGSSRGTAEVIFTILNSGKSWTSNESDEAEISWGASSQPSPKKKELSATGYFKKSVISEKLDKNLATVTVKKDSPGIVQGGLFWQYYEDLDKIKSSETYISITKELYRKIKTENGEELQKISENSPLKVGDKVTVRMILNTDRNMEFIHLKDMRAAGFEPLDLISGYQWKNNLGYYQSTKDASTNFYIQYMPKGKYVFEYDYICNAAGNFSNGITTLQNYYAPQMNAHTKGTKVKIAE